jgi:hypothetical protein
MRDRMRAAATRKDPDLSGKVVASSMCEGTHAGLAAFRVLAPAPTGRVAGEVGLSPCGKKTPVQKNIVKHPKND